MEVKKTNNDSEATHENELGQQRLEANQRELKSISLDMIYKTELLNKLKAEIDELNKLNPRGRRRTEG